MKRNVHYEGKWCGHSLLLPPVLSFNLNELFFLLFYGTSQSAAVEHLSSSTELAFSTTDDANPTTDGHTTLFLSFHLLSPVLAVTLLLLHYSALVHSSYHCFDIYTPFSFDISTLAPLLAFLHYSFVTTIDVVSLINEAKN